MPVRRLPGSPPAIPAGSWQAAGNRFFKMTPPRPVPMGRFRRLVTISIGNTGIASGVISGGGTATVQVAPQGYGTRWYPGQVSIATATGASDVSTCAFFLNVIGPLGFLAQSYAGGGDQPGLALPSMQPGDILYAMWSGGHAGDWCQLAVTGTMDVLVP